MVVSSEASFLNLSRIYLENIGQYIDQLTKGTGSPLLGNCVDYHFSHDAALHPCWD